MQLQLDDYLTVVCRQCVSVACTVSVSVGTVWSLTPAVCCQSATVACTVSVSAQRSPTPRSNQSHSGKQVRPPSAVNPGAAMSRVAVRSEIILFTTEHSRGWRCQINTSCESASMNVSTIPLVNGTSAHIRIYSATEWCGICQKNTEENSVVCCCGKRKLTPHYSRRTSRRCRSTWLCPSFGSRRTTHYSSVQPMRAAEHGLRPLRSSAWFWNCGTCSTLKQPQRKNTSVKT